MHKDLKAVFSFLEELFPGQAIAIIGSAVKDYDSAADIDVLLPHSVEWKAAMKLLRTKYNGWDTLQGHLRRANLQIKGVGKKVQILQVESVPTAHDHPNAALLSDGTILKSGMFFDKSKAKSNFR